MKKLKVAIAGYGIVGKKRHLYINENSNLEVVAISDNNLEQITIKEDNILVFSDYDTMLELKFDILFVCLVNNVAADATIKGLKKGCHVFCEKPPGMNVKEIEEVIAIEKEYPNLKLKYGFNHRYHDSVEKALNIIKSKEIGEIIHMRGVYGKSKIIPFSGGWRSKRELAGGGILLDQGIHMLDLMRLFSGDFVQIKSFVSNKYWGHDVEDNAYALLKDSKGRVSMLNSSATQWQHKFSLEITLSEGFIVLDGVLSGSKSYGDEKIIIGKRDKVSDTGQMEFIENKFLVDNSWKKEIDEFTNAILYDKKIDFGSSHDALETMKLVFGIYYDDKEWSKKYNLTNQIKNE